MDTGFPPEGPIQLPSEFQVNWSKEEHSKLLWIWDDVHSPLPATTLQQSISRATGRGIGRAARELKVPTGGPRRDINGYAYIAYLSSPPPEAEIASHEETINKVVPNFKNRWDEEFLPHIISNNKIIKSYSTDQNHSDSLSARLKNSVEIMQEHYYIHFLVIFTLFGATEKLSKLYSLITDSKDELEPYELLQGSMNTSITAGKRLSDLAEYIKNDPELIDMFRENGAKYLSKVMTNASIKNDLQKIPYGLFTPRHSLSNRFAEYLEEFGYRSISEDINSKLWIEDPSYPVIALKAYVLSKVRNLDEDLSVKTNRAEALLNSLLEINREKGIVDESELISTVKHAKDLWPLREDHAHYIDQQTNAYMRLLVLECASELKQMNYIEENSDIFHLTLDEVIASLERAPTNLKETIEDRKKTYRRFLVGSPPRFLGTMPSKPPVITGELSKFFNPVAQVNYQNVEELKVIKGTAGSPGIHTGIARVILTPESFSSVNPGDILVTRTTNPSWAPIFGVIGGLITDSGGVLSHGAIVAREMNLPAVMGTKGATTLIVDGQLVTINGTTGVITLS
jgi:pyruvate,water dikinase